MSSVQSDEAEVAATPHFPGFDGLRAIAALAVVIGHVATWTGLDTGATAAGPYLARAGQFGVAVFFVISGFLLYRPYVASHVTGQPAPVTSEFLRRRFFRVFPAYWVALATLLWVVHHASARSPKDVVQQFLLLQVYDERTVLDGLPQAWSLCVEISFYVLLPAIALGVVHLARLLRSPLTAEFATVAGLYVVGVLFRFVVLAVAPELQSPTFLWLLGTIDWFALGMAGAVCSVAGATGRQIPRVADFLGRRPAVAWLLAGEMYWILVQMNLPSGFAGPTAAQHMGKHLLLGAAAVCLVAPAAFRTRRPSTIRTALAAWPLHAIGTVSYSVFLWHMLWARVLAEWLDIPMRAGGFWPLLLGTLAVTLPFAALSYGLIERPAMHIGRTTPKPLATPSPAAVTS